MRHSSDSEGGRGQGARSLKHNKTLTSILTSLCRVLQQTAKVGSKESMDVKNSLCHLVFFVEPDAETVETIPKYRPPDVQSLSQSTR